MSLKKSVKHWHRFQPILPRSSLLTIYKTFFRSQLDWCHLRPSLWLLFREKLESLQQNACLAITETIRGTPSEKLYQELGLESLKSRHWFRKLCHFYKILNEKLHHIYQIWFLTWIKFVKLGIVIIFLQFIQDTITSRIHFFLLLYLNGTISIAKLETQEVRKKFLKRTCLTLYDLVQIVFSIFMTHMESNSLQDCV